MPTTSYLKRRGAVCYIQLVVPLDVREAIGRTILSKSLDTRELRVANVRKLAMLAEWQRQFDDDRRRRDLCEADFAAAWQHYSAGDRQPGADSTDRRRDACLSRRRSPLPPNALRDHLGRGETVLITWAADAYIAKHQLTVERGSRQYRGLCFRMMRAEIEKAQRAIERDQGDYAGAPRDPAAVPAEAVVGPSDETAWYDQSAADITAELDARIADELGLLLAV